MAAPQEEERLTSLRNLAVVFGGLAGLGGITHGVGEMLQGSRPPRGIVFESWVATAAGIAYDIRHASEPATISTRSHRTVS